MADHGHGGVFIFPGFDEALGDVVEVAEAHEEYEGAFEFRDVGEIQASDLIFEIAGKYMERGGPVSVGHGDPCVAGAGDGRGDAGNDFHGNTAFHEVDAFFAAAAEDIGIAAFQTDDGFAFFGFLVQRFVDLILRHGVVGRLFAHVDFFAVSRCAVDQVFVDETVIDQHIGGFDELQAFEGDEPVVAGACAD